VTSFFGDRLSGVDSVCGRKLPTKPIAVNTGLAQWRYRAACDKENQQQE